jgi:hypothetical protein
VRMKIPSKGVAARGSVALLLVGMTLALTVGAAQAITFGQPDGNLHPNVGALVADWDPDSPGPDSFCSGTLIAPRCSSPPPTARCRWKRMGSPRCG